MRIQQVFAAGIGIRAIDCDALVGQAGPQPGVPVAALPFDQCRAADGQAGHRRLDADAGSAASLVGHQAQCKGMIVEQQRIGPGVIGLERRAVELRGIERA